MARIRTKKAMSQTLDNPKKRGFVQNMKLYKEYYIMLIPGLLFFLIFCYGPMYGLAIAFQEYYPLKGISGSKWVGFQHFIDLFSNPFFLSVLKNTIIISLYKLLICFPAPILLCLALNEIKSMKFKKVAQSISYLPHFVSWVVVSGIIIEFCLRPEDQLISFCKIWDWNPFFSWQTADISGAFWCYPICGKRSDGVLSYIWRL